jgi:predicted transcriptional regulator
MPSGHDVIDAKTVRSLVEAEAIGGATILGQPGGWAVLVRYGSAERVVGGQKTRRMRLWRRLESASTFVRRELRLPRFDVDAAAYDPDAIERKRPDQAERLRRQREAAEYDAWFRAEVQEGLDALARGELSSQEEVEEDWRRERADLVRRIERNA